MNNLELNNNIKLNLSYAYRIIGMLNLDDHTYTHLSARSAESDSYFIFRFGNKFSEVTENNLLKVNFEGKVLEGEEYEYNKTGYIIHGSIYEKRPDINSIFHLHTEDVVSVSSMKCGLMPISQWALHFYKRISYHDYNSLALNKENHSDKLIEDLGKNFTMLLRNHGSLTCGRTIHEAMFYTHHLEQACKLQNIVMATNQELIIPDEETCIRSVNDLLSFEKDLGLRDWNAWVRQLKIFEK